MRSVRAMTVLVACAASAWMMGCSGQVHPCTSEDQYENNDLPDYASMCAHVSPSKSECESAGCGFDSVLCKCHDKAGCDKLGGTWLDTCEKYFNSIVDDAFDCGTEGTVAVGLWFSSVCCKNKVSNCVQNWEVSMCRSSDQFLPSATTKVVGDPYDYDDWTCASVVGTLYENLKEANEKAAAGDDSPCSFYDDAFNELAKNCCKDKISICTPANAPASDANAAEGASMDV